MTISEKLADAAEIDLAIPYSLVCDAWDMADNTYICREQFETYLNQAFEAYNANQTKYVFNRNASF